MSASQTIIVGAGPAGLATAGCLRRRGLPFVIIERAPDVGQSWRDHYARLHLHTPRRHSGLPGWPMPTSYPEFASRAQVVDYLAAYAAHFAIAPRLGETVQRVARGPDCGWVVQTEREELRGASVVMATGYNRVPVRPSWPGEGEYVGRILHSRDYHSGAEFRGKRVLVVGIGNTGAELALDLHEQGAASVAIAVRGPVDVVPRKFLGLPLTNHAIAMQRLPVAIEDRVGAMVSRVAFGKLAQLGLVPTGKAMSRVHTHGRIPLIDIGTVAAIKRGDVVVVGGVDWFTPTGVIAGGRAVDVDVVLLATGYRAGLEELLADAALVLDDGGRPRDQGRPTALPGLYFVGFANVPTGLLRELGRDAERVAAAIAGA